MGQVVKTYLGIFLMMLLTMAGIGIITAEIEVAKARNYKTDVVIELENSAYNPKVAQMCVKQAEESGYILELLFYDAKGRVYRMDALEENSDVTIDMAEVYLSYQYRIGPFHSSGWHSIRGMAR